MKTLLRKANARTLDSLNDAIDHGIAQVTSADALGWFKHCGYSINPI